MTADSQPNSEAQALESRALEVWLENHQALKRIAGQIVGESSTAEDTVQRAWFQAREHPPRRLTFAWLARVVRNLALDEVRRRDSQTAPVDLPEESWAPTDAASPEAIAVTLETYRELAGAVAELPEAQRQAVYLRYFEGRTPTELARSLGVPVATVKKRLERALDRLRSRYENPAQRGRLLAVIAMPPPSMVTGGVGQVIGVLLMKKALLTAAVVVAACIIGFFALREAPDRLRGEPSQPSLPVDVAQVPGDEEFTGPPAVLVDARSESVRTASAVEGSGTSFSRVDVKVVHHDGLPAVGLPVTLAPSRRNWFPTSPESARRTTDASGVAHFDGPFSEVTWTAEAATGGRVSIDLGEPGLHRALLRLEPGIELSVRVLDPSGRGVSGASIWLDNRHRDWRGGNVVAQTSITGDATLRSVAPSQNSIGAFAPGYAPSPLRALRHIEPRGDRVEVELTLLPGGARCTGQVLAPDGDPVGDARVALGGWVGEPDESENSRMRWAPRLTTTRSDGTFAFEGASSGKQCLAVAAAGFPTWTAAVQLAPETSETHVIQLEAAASLHGVVRYADGQPAAGAAVRILDETIDETLLSVDQFGYDHPFGYPCAVTDEEGRYRIDSLWPGVVEAYASEKSTALDHQAMRDRAALDLEAGTAHEWNPVFQRGPEIRGQALFADGTPMRRVFVIAKRSDTGASSLARADYEGRFELLNLADVPYRLEADPHDALAPDRPPVVLEGVMPSPVPLELVASFPPPSHVRTGIVRGVLADDGGRVHEALDFKLEGPRALGRVWRTIDGPRFEFSRTLPGSHRLVVYSGKHPVHVTERFSVRPGETVDLGVVTTRQAGAILVEVERGVGTEFAAGTLTLEHAPTGKRIESQLPSDQASLTVPNLSAGRYELSLQGQDLLRTQATVDVREGETAVMQLAIPPMVQRDFRLHGTEGAAIELELTDPSGAVLWSAPLQSYGAGESTDLSLPVPLGFARLLMRSESGEELSVEFDTPSLDASLPRVDLR